MTNPLRDTPHEVIATLAQWGGNNEYGEPNWRVILAENHLVQRAGMWTDFDEGTEQVEFTPGKGGLAYKTQQIAPDSIRIGVFWVPKYQVTGWVLERWFPASAYGDREQWESALSQDNETPMMGPFPERGGYFMLTGPWEQIPNLEDIRASIAGWENASHSHGNIDVEAMQRAMQNEMAAQHELEEQKYQQLLEDVEYRRVHQLEFIKGNPALSGFRNRVANDNGLTEHI